ncbi:hypothetical protein FRC03_010047 [Tulasnella sp. 419]|nr:hypothetical protein FRC03_010047 [Tulasnella sp. 419]
MPFSFTPTQDWFSGNVPTWKSLFPLVKSSAPRVLEIGSWEGRSAVFLLQELCGEAGEIVCIDHFDLLQTAAGKERYDRMKGNLSNTNMKFRIIGKFSVPALYTLLEEAASEGSPGFDWVYVDGSHEADDTLLDGELAWRLARKDAIFIFDDYRWPNEPEGSRHHPKRGIDAFLQLHVGEYRIVSGTQEGHYQMILQKTSEMRIGFLIEPEEENGASKQPWRSLEYGINVALTIDSLYAVPAAVAIQTLVETTPGRITIYVVDHGLSIGDREKLSTSAQRPSGEVTIKFIDPPTNSLAQTLGCVWSKMEMPSLLPAERVLYLDADILIRRDIRELWETDLDGKPLGAAVDVGHPMGHDGSMDSPYFNAGVLLMDLARIRGETPKLVEMAGQFKDSMLKDQDALNRYFQANWKNLGLRWNAQGLGTYANSPSPQRSQVPDLDIMKKEPAIVHFTGPLHPPIGHILNPWVQPCTAKPWGYAGSPGHPYAEEWWDVVERTAWKGWRKSLEFKEACDSALAKITQNAIDEVAKKVEESRRLLL